MKRLPIVLFTIMSLVTVGCTRSALGSKEIGTNYIEAQGYYNKNYPRYLGDCMYYSEDKTSLIDDSIYYADKVTTDVSVQPIFPEEGEDVKEITIASVGDIMMHKTEINSGYLGNGNYDFSMMFSNIKPYIDKADFSLGNLEVTLSGKEKEYTGYPMFNAPEILAQNIKDAGFDLVTTANNHSLDRKFYGVQKTIENLDKVGLLHTGSFKTFEDSENILVKDIRGIKIAFLAYTYDTNGITIPEKFAVNLIDKGKILKDIQKAKALKVDIIVASMHFGVEYKTIQNKSQEELADFLFTNGVDIILGSHPHVLQPMEIRKMNIDGKEKEVFVIYSQGNIVADMPQRYKNSGIILNLHLRKDISGTKLSKVDYIPTWVDRDHKTTTGKSVFQVLPILSEKDYQEHKKHQTVRQSFNDSLSIVRTLDPKISLFEKLE